MENNKVYIIAVEGPDGAGKTTLVEGLHKKLAAYTDTRTVRQASAEPVGLLIRQTLRGAAVRAFGMHADEPWQPDEATMGLLFAADRVDLWRRELATPGPRIVLTDRHYYSTFAYQHAVHGLPKAWCAEINRFAPQPFLTLSLCVSPETSAWRRADRGTHVERYEKSETQAKVAAYYARLDREFPDEAVALIDAEHSSVRVLDDAFIAVRRAFRRLPASALTTAF